MYEMRLVGRSLFSSKSTIKFFVSELRLSFKVSQVLLVIIYILFSHRPSSDLLEIFSAFSGTCSHLIVSII